MKGIQLAFSGLIVSTLVISSCSNTKVQPKRSLPKQAKTKTLQQSTNTIITKKPYAAKPLSIKKSSLPSSQHQKKTTYQALSAQQKLNNKLAHNKKRALEIELVNLRQKRHKEWNQRRQNYHVQWSNKQRAKANLAKPQRTAFYGPRKPKSINRYQVRPRQVTPRSRARSLPKRVIPRALPMPRPRIITPQFSSIDRFSRQLSNAALNRTRHKVTYNGRYEKLNYPWGDVSPSIGVCTDVVIRSYRKLGIDLQKDVHEDMLDNFHAYPNLNKWKLSKPDSNIDHRRVYNLQAFFKRNGTVLPITNNPLDYNVGDIVTWNLFPGQEHIGIVVNQKSPTDPNRFMMVHNIANGPEIEDVLFRFKITGHYRYYGMNKPL